MKKTALVEKIISEFTDKISQKMTIDDGVTSIRIIGEFSAGKTRLVKELLHDYLPGDLLPISSLERQTYLPLEITFGSENRLTLVKKEDDASPAETVRTFSVFPDRDALKSLKLEPKNYRLRLEVPEQRLIIQNEGYYDDDRQPRRIFLIDMPGWGSQETDIENKPESDLMHGEWNRALVYVCNVTRLDSAENRSNLKIFLEACADATPAGDTLGLVYLVSHCQSSEQNKVRKRETERIERLLEESGLNKDDYRISVLCVDFGEMSAQEKTDFRNVFWDAVECTQTETSADASFTWASVINNWPGKWDIRPMFKKIQEAFLQTEKLVSGFKKNDRFLADMNMTRLAGTNAAERREKLLRAWHQQLGIRDSASSFCPSDINLEYDHPLYRWWTDYFLKEVKICLEPVENLFETMKKVLSEVPADTENLENYISLNISNRYNQTSREWDNSFVILCQCAAKLYEKQESLSKTVATVLALSVLDSKYRDYLQK